MDSNKAWYLSRGMWGGIVAGIATVVDLGVEEQNEIIEVILKVAEVGGALLAVWGRLVAKSRLRA